MKKLFVALFAVSLLATAPARADYATYDMTTTSPAGASTTAIAYTTLAETSMFTSCSFIAKVQGGTGGTLDIYVQTFSKSLLGGMWSDVAHLPQQAAGGALNKVAFTLTRFSPSSSAITAALNVVDGTPSLAVNTVVPGLLGTKLRLVYVTGAGNTVGASQIILATCSST